MNSLSHYRDELLRDDVTPRKLNDIAKKHKDLLIRELDEDKIKIEKISVCKCGSTNLEQLTKIDRYGLPFGSLICKNCGLVLTNPRIKQESLPYYYENFYHPLNYGKERLDGLQALFQVGQGKKIFEIVNHSLPKKKKWTILEIGAGTGSVLREFKNEALLHNIEIDELGTEYSHDCLSLCEKNGVNVIHGDLDTIANMTDTFDLIILSHVFEHFIDLEAELSKIKTLLKNRGILYIEVPGIERNNTVSTYNFDFLEYLTHAHMYNFNAYSLEKIMSLNGYCKISINETVESVFVPDPQGSGTIDYQDNHKRILTFLKRLVLSKKFLGLGMKHMIEKKNIRIDTRDNEIRAFKKIIEKQNIRIDTRDNEIRAFKKTIEKQNIRIDTRVNEIRAFKKIIEKENIRIDTRVNEIRAFKKIIEKQNIRIDTRVNEIRAFKKTIEKQNIRIDTRDNEIRAFKKIIEKQNIRIDTRDNEIRAFKKIIEKQNKSISSILNWIENKENSYTYRIFHLFNNELSDLKKVMK